MTWCKMSWFLRDLSGWGDRELADGSPLLPLVTRSSGQLSARDGKKQAPAAQPSLG